MMFVKESSLRNTSSSRGERRSEQEATKRRVDEAKSQTRGRTQYVVIELVSVVI